MLNFLYTLSKFHELINMYFLLNIQLYLQKMLKLQIFSWSGLDGCCSASIQHRLYSNADMLESMYHRRNKQCVKQVSMNVKYWYKCPLLVPSSHLNTMLSIACPDLTAGERYDKHGVQPYSTLKLKPLLGLKKMIKQF